MTTTLLFAGIGDTVQTESWVGGNLVKLLLCRIIKDVLCGGESLLCS